MSLISIVVPVYYNAPTLKPLFEELQGIARTCAAHNFEFIFVDDGSGDNSYAVLQDIATTDNRVKVVKLVRNFGSNVAILAGLTYAKGDCAAFIAADLQDPPESLIEMIHCWENGTSTVLAVRKDRNGDPFLTRAFATMFNVLFQKFVFNTVSPQGVGFFLIDRKVVDVLIQSQEPNTHLIGLVLWAGFPYETITYDRLERKVGKSRWTFQKKLKYFIDAFAAFSYLPLRISSIMGLVFAGISGTYAIVIILLRILGFLPDVQGWAALMVVTLFVSGVQLIMLGVIGEYIWRNFDATRKRPLFIVQSVVTHSEQ